jgi:Restriction endonuclease BamHI
MKIVHVKRLLDKGGFSATEEWQVIERHIMQAIKTIEWPPNSGSFTLYPESGKKLGEGNGVKPIKEACMLHLGSLGWKLEQELTAIDTGKIDAAYRVGERLFCVERETGNVSSSHRAINKMALGMLKDILIGGILILPTRAMYRYLTDRIGNFPEIQPYFPLWQSLDKSINEGLLAVIAIEQDAISEDVPRIRKGTDGRALL